MTGCGFFGKIPAKGYCGLICPWQCYFAACPGHQSTPLPLAAVASIPIFSSSFSFPQLSPRSGPGPLSGAGPGPGHRPSKVLRRTLGGLGPPALIGPGPPILGLTRDLHPLGSTADKTKRKHKESWLFGRQSSGMDGGAVFRLQCFAMFAALFKRIMIMKNLLIILKSITQVVDLAQSSSFAGRVLSDIGYITNMCYICSVRATV